MNAPTRRGRLIRFSVFELDLDSAELFKQGRKVKLQGQPFEVLLALLDRSGEVVSREELKQKLWPSDTAGDFDQGLNRAINKVREALGDTAKALSSWKLCRVADIGSSVQFRKRPASKLRRLSHHQSTVRPLHPVHWRKRLIAVVAQQLG